METGLDPDKVNTAIECIQAAFYAANFPQGFLEKYDQMECLSCHNGRETFVVREKTTKRLFVAKCYDSSVYQGAQGRAMLRTLRHPGLPAFEEVFEDEGMVCGVREYIEGTPLDQYAAKHPLSEGQIVRLCVQLCNVLTYLHEQTPPVIHRDIKPQNIILRDSGAPVLIDFDTARLYKPEAKTDTQFFGTREYAPPEQYGFTQTDCRADIYALGVLLRFLSTGDAKEDAAREAPSSLQKIIQKCTAFSPAQRFSSVRAVRKALLYAAANQRFKRNGLLTLTVVAAVFLCAGLALGQYIPILFAPAQGVSFTEPLIESAVRAQLNKGNGEPITQGDLQAVRELYIFGQEVSSSAETFASGFTGRERGMRGNIDSLDDLVMLPNLEVVMICYQSLENLSGLAALKNIASVSFMHTGVSDLSPLAHMLRLDSANFFDTNVSDTTVLSSCPRLWQLNLGRTLVSSLEKVGCYETLESLYLDDVQFETLKGIERFKRLKELYVAQAEAPDWDVLRNAPALETLFVDKEQETSLSSLLEGSDFSIVIEN